MFLKASLGYFRDLVSELLIIEFLKIKIDKSFQFTDWSIRPLSKSKIDYAANDVNYLCDVYEIQKELLKKLK